MVMLFASMEGWIVLLTIPRIVNAQMIGIRVVGDIESLLYHNWAFQCCAPPASARSH